MQIPKISVVMSVFNGGEYLKIGVDSILKQSFRNFEFIIIDDCSTDESYSILAKYADEDNRIRLYKNDKNIGVAGFIKNLNRGIGLAKGELIARMDQDDIAHPDRFQKQLDFLEADPSVQLLGSNIILIDEDGTKCGELSAPATDKDIKKRMPKKISLYHPAIMFRNNGLKYREKMLYCEDYDLYLRAVSDGARFANIQLPLLEYRIHKKSMSRKNAFIRNLFVERCREFYKQRQNKGTDDYDSFNPESFVKILDKANPAQKKDLIFALKTSLKYNNIEEFHKLANQNTANGAYYALKFLLLAPPKLRRAILNFNDRYLHQIL